MRHYQGYAYREITGQRVISLLILLAVILSTAMTTAVGWSIGVLSAMRLQQAVTIGGDRYATFLQMEEAQAEKLEKDGRLSFVGRYVTLGVTELSDFLSLGLKEYQEDVEAVYPSLARVKEGRLPKAPMEIALPERVLGYLGAEGEIGERILLDFSKALRHGIETEEYEASAEFVLVGILEENYLNDIGGGVMGIVGEGTAKMLLPERYLYYNVDIRTGDKKTFQDTMDELIEALSVHELDVLYNTIYLDALGIAYQTEEEEGLRSDQGFWLLSAAGVMVGALFLLAAGLVVVNILKIDIARKRSEYGVLRAIGAGRGQLCYLVLLRMLFLCIPGIPAGVFIGVLSAKGILKAATGLLSPEIFLVRDGAELSRLIEENASGRWGFLLAGAAVTLLSMVGAALPAARHAAKVTPVEAMAQFSVKIRRRNRKAVRIRHFERYYAMLNLRRNPGRTACCVLSLVMSIVVFITLQGSVSLLNGADAAKMHLGDYSVINEEEGFSPDKVRAMEADEQVLSVAAFQFTLYELDQDCAPVGIDLEKTLQPGETFQIIGMNEAYMEAELGDCLTEEEMGRLKAGEGCVVRNPLPLIFDGEEIPRTEIQAGEEIAAAGKKLPVLYTLNGYDKYFSVGNNGFVNGVQVLVNEKRYVELTGKVNYNEMLLTLVKDADRDMFDQKIKDLAENLPGTAWLSYEDADRQLAESFEQIRLMAWGLILFVGMIGLLNIVNTACTNIQTRMTEIGIWRAIGMSRESLYGVFLWESAYIGLIAALAGSTLGYLGLLFVEAGTTGAWQWIAVPVVPVLEASLLSLGACLMASVVPLFGNLRAR